MAETLKLKSTTAVIGIDDSKHSKYAFQWYAKKIYKRGDNVVLVYGVEIDFINSAIRFNAPFSIDDSQTLQRVLEEERKISGKILEQYLKLMETNKVKGTVQTAHSTKPGEGILKVATDMKADFVVVGCRKHGKLHRTFLGSVSDYILHHSTMPVLICPYRDQDPS